MKPRNRAASNTAGVVIVIAVIAFGLYTGIFSGLLGSGGGKVTIQVSGSVDGGPLNSPFQVAFTDQGTGKTTTTSVNGIVGIGDSYSVALYNDTTYLVQIVYDNILEQQGSCNAGFMYLYLSSAAFTANISCGGGPYGTQPPQSVTFTTTTRTTDITTILHTTTTTTCLSVTTTPTTTTTLSTTTTYTTTTAHSTTTYYTTVISGTVTGTATTISGQCYGLTCTVVLETVYCYGPVTCSPISAPYYIFTTNCLSNSCSGQTPYTQGTTTSNGFTSQILVPASQSQYTACVDNSGQLVCENFVPGSVALVVITYGNSLDFITNC